MTKSGDINGMLDFMTELIKTIKLLKKEIEKSKPTMDRLKKLEKYAKGSSNSRDVKAWFLMIMSDDETFDKEIEKV